MPNNNKVPRSPYIAGTPDALDAVIAAPDNHEVVFENETVRVLKVLVRPGEIEKEHTHRWPSVFTITSMPKIKYYNHNGEECPLDGTRQEGVPFWIEPEGLHAVENPSDVNLEAIRVELKG